MGLISPTLPTSGQDRGAEEIDVLNTLTALVNVVNGSIDDANISALGATSITDGVLTADKLITALRQQLGVTDSSAVRRGKTNITTEESRTNVAYGKMATPDQVSGVVLPTDGLLFIAYHANTKNSVASAGQAAIFLGTNQLKRAENAQAAPVVQEAILSSNVDTYNLLNTTPSGLSLTSQAANYTGDVTTGQVLIGNATAGGFVAVFAAAGTYDVSVQFKSTSGSVTVKERKLWVWTLGF